MHRKRWINKLSVLLVVAGTGMCFTDIGSAQYGTSMTAGGTVSAAIHSEAGSLTEEEEPPEEIFLYDDGSENLPDDESVNENAAMQNPPDDESAAEAGASESTAPEEPDAENNETSDTDIPTTTEAEDSEHQDRHPDETQTQSQASEPAESGTALSDGNHTTEETAE